MDWTRRQFGLWSTAALLTSHHALAAPPQAESPPAKSKNPPGRKMPAASAEPDTPPPTPGQDLSPLVLTATLDRNEPRRLRYAIAVRNEGEQPLTFNYELTKAALVDAKGGIQALEEFPSDGTLAYFEQRHPFARRLMTPGFVDVAPGKLVALEGIQLDLPEKRPDVVELRVTVSLYEGLGEAVRTVDLVIPWPGAPNS